MLGLGKVKVGVVSVGRRILFLMCCYLIHQRSSLGLAKVARVFFVVEVIHHVVELVGNVSLGPNCIVEVSCPLPVFDSARLRPVQRMDLGDKVAWDPETVLTLRQASASHKVTDGDHLIASVVPLVLQSALRALSNRCGFRREYVCQLWGCPVKRLSESVSSKGVTSACSRLCRK